MDDEATVDRIVFDDVDDDGSLMLTCLDANDENEMLPFLVTGNRRMFVTLK